MKTMKVRLTLIEPILGTSPANEEIYRSFIGSNAPDAPTLEEEVSDLGVDAVAERGMTIFPKLEDGTPFVYDYQIKGFFKGACSMLRKVTGTESAKIKAFKKQIDGLIFPAPRKIPFENYGEIRKCERPLRASTPQGERVSLACSEEVPDGATLTFSIVLLVDSDEKLVREWLDYGRFSGLGQWRNSGKGRYVYDELDDDGNIIGGNAEGLR